MCAPHPAPCTAFWFFHLPVLRMYLNNVCCASISKTLLCTYTEFKCSDVVSKLWLFAATACCSFIRFTFHLQRGRELISLGVSIQEEQFCSASLLLGIEPRAFTLSFIARPVWFLIWRLSFTLRGPTGLEHAMHLPQPPRLLVLELHLVCLINSCV